MNGIFLPALLVFGALLAAAATYRNIRRGGARFYTLEREIVLRRAALTLAITILLFLGSFGLLFYQRQQLITTLNPPDATVESAIGPEVVTPTPLFEQFPPTVTATSTTPEPTMTPTPTVCRAVVEGTSGNGLYLRDAPQGSELVVLAEGSLLTVLEDAAVEAGGVTWRKVRAIGGDEGWAADTFLTIRAPCGDE